MSTKKTPSFGALKISANNPSAAVMPPAEPAVEHAAVEFAPAEKKAEARPSKTVPVRLTREQWIEAKDFAARYDTSLQELFIVGLNMVRASKGLPPLTGTRFK
ncbi:MULTISPECIES: hypothetical protein [Pseudomonadota]|uniref:hypothetical protein n=1 Tax=Pseudomonadota TaxID=1224 RepID=UPI00089992C6|nr:MULTISPECIES: hypothetical protein [Pseudomonadota]SEF14477.1 hypothetical protein SAMN02787142_8314 [Burkholderia sp. WP9]SEP48077.1 hypothetical protein SAMN02787149_1343 [Pseudomonas sp. Snoq117.2]